ncbi:hypothetical protein [Phenylobacterium sp.]|uniref:hypothetical protein n=1 Tax=Phenylobacterium sp. TaxID=1871053 RepID=UPI0035670268
MSVFPPPPQSPPPPDSDEALADAEALLSPGLIVQAACKTVIGVFDTVAAQLPELIRAQAPPESPVPQFAAEMVELMQRQLRRAMGDLPGKAGPK